MIYLKHYTDLFHFHAMHLSRGMGFQTMWYVRPAKPQIRAFASRLNIL